MDSNVDICKHVVVFGISHNTGSLGVREKILFAEQDIPEALSELCKLDGVLEAVILSTCNRVEIYAVIDKPDKAQALLSSFISAKKNIPLEDFEKHIYFHRCNQAVEHLFHVTGSLDSLVVGEAQILSQVKNAFSVARENGSTGIVLNKLFLFAITSGKRVRSETKIGKGAVSISQAGVELAKKILGQLTNHCAMIIGAGEMSELTAKHLKSAGIRKLFFANRTLDRAAALSAQFDGAAINLAEMPGILPECDIVISSTASPDYIIDVDDMREVIVKRKNQPILLIDIAAPRDIHPDVGKLYNVFLYTIDDLAQVAKYNVEARTNEIAAAMIIINEEMNEYFEWYNYLRVQPIVVSLRKKFDTIRDKNLTLLAGQIAEMPEETRNLIKNFASELTDDFFEMPSIALRESAGTSDWMQLSDALTKLFKLK